MKPQVAEMDELAKIRIVRRRAKWADRGVSYKVFVDDEMVEKVRNGETKEVSVRPGRHRVRVMVSRRQGSEEWGVELRRGEWGGFECRPSSEWMAVRILSTRPFIDLRPLDE